MRIIGIMLVRDEDLFVEFAIRNAMEFCDEFLVADHGSRDRTPEILARLSLEYADKLRVRQISNPRESHDWIREYCGQDLWVFGVDGDEIYDPDGLRRLKKIMEEGRFDRDWCVFGNVLNVRDWLMPEKMARGHLAPPCRSMTKLYNFRLIEDWNGKDCVERLHGGGIQFRDGFNASLRRDLYKETSWEDAAFRCLHLCFLRRSSLENEGTGPRKNIMDKHSWTLKKLMGRIAGIFGAATPDWKEQRYARGPLVDKSFESFLTVTDISA